MPLNEKRTTDPAFGQISALRVSGQANLFMVDYPQQHYIRLSINAAELHRNLSNDWIFGRETLIDVEMSEVQWARMIASMNTTGVPCTLHRYVDPKSGQWVTPKMPAAHLSKKETFIAELREDAVNITKDFDDTREAIKKMLEGNSLKKGDLQAVLKKLDFAIGTITGSLPFVVQQAEEAIEKAVESAKAEVDTHVDFTMTRLGERALGERLEAAIEADADVGAIGRKVDAVLSLETKP